ncbi:MAG: rhomboid family intramembrane serine protease [Actinobacteria bacterium]|jgi:membrane associated rhomboid family serine protease|nr:rhomboid family intramembrane serine protease [Actinomycetota bacterium]
MSTFQRCAWHPETETGLSCQRCERPICAKCLVDASVGFQCPECAKDKQVTRTLNSFARPVISQIIIVACVALFIFSYGANKNEIISNFGLNPILVQYYGEYYRLITSMFLHVNIMHIVFNMLALWQVGLVLESRLGKFKFAVIYFLSGISGGLLSVYMNEPMAFSIGASGAVFGLFGAYVAISRRLNADANGMLVMIAINLGLGFVVPNIDWHGHVGGLVAGFLLGNLVELRRR